MGIHEEKKMSMRFLCVLAVAAFCASTLAASETDLPVEPREAVAPVDEQNMGAPMWRVLSKAKVPLENWLVTHLRFFESLDGSGDPVNCEAIASTYKGMSATPIVNDFEPAKATDGNDDTNWESENGEAGQWIGIKCTEYKDIKSIAMQVPNPVMAPAAVEIQKSVDFFDANVAPATVAEISDMKSWGKKLELYKLRPQDIQPKSLFAIRSQKDPNLCVGVRTRLTDPDDEMSAVIKIEDQAVVELQRCDDDVTTQWWSFDQNSGLLHSAADEIYVIRFEGDPEMAKPDEGGNNLIIGMCSGEKGCPKAGKFKYNDSVNGGFMRSGFYDRANLVFSAAPEAGGELKAGTAMKASPCGPTNPAQASLLVPECKAREEDPGQDFGRFELPPMFNVEEGRRAIKCSPYSHSLLQPETATNRQQAQRLCAKDIKCSAYNWGKIDAEPANTVYLCYKLHNVYAGAEEEAWELGVRAGRAYDSPYDELMQQKTKTKTEV